MRKRNKRILVRLTEKEYKQIKLLAKKENTTMNNIIRTRMMNTHIKHLPEDFYIELAEKMNTIGKSINDIARIANETEIVSKGEMRRVTDLMNSVTEFVKEEKE